MAPSRGPLNLFRFGVIPKGSSGDWRLILNLSYPENFSINDGISDSNASVSYQGLNFVIDRIILAGRNAFLSKFDIERAYRKIPVRESDRYLLGMRWAEQFFVDLTLPFGGRSAPAIFTAVADVLTFICSQDLLYSLLSHYLDDFLLISGDDNYYLYFYEENAIEDFVRTHVLLDRLGVPRATEKTIPPTKCLEFLGVILDIVKFEARLSLE